MANSLAPLTLDDRTADEVLTALLARLPAYVPGWRPQPGGNSAALLQIFARNVQVLIERLNAAPDKNLLAFLDLLGTSLVPAQAARAPVVLQFQPPTPPQLPTVATAPLPGGVTLPAPPTALSLPPISIRVPAGTQIAANVPGSSTPLIFETEQVIALTGAKLAQVVSLSPSQDAYIDHTAALASKTPFTLFRSADAQPTPHILYLAHDGYFALTGQSIVEIEFDLLTPSSVELSPIVWEYYDGQGWHPFGDPDLKTSSSSSGSSSFSNGASASNQASAGVSGPSTIPHGAIEDGTNGFTRGGIITLTSDCVDTQKVAVNGVEALWLRARMTTPLPPDLSRQDAAARRIRVNTVIERLLSPDGLDGTINWNTMAPTAGVKPDNAFSNGTSLDVSKAFYPFGQTPQAGDVFYFSSEEVFSKPNANVRLAVKVAKIVTGLSNSPVLKWEYFDGRRWIDLNAQLALGTGTMTNDAVFRFTVPDPAIPKTKIFDKDGRWVRARVDSGSYSIARTIGYKDAQNNNQTLTIVEPAPPQLADIRFAYVYRSPRAFPERALTYNDFLYEDHTAEVKYPGQGFALFHSVSDLTPALYLGFDQQLPADFVSLYLDIAEREGAPPGPPLTWEYWDGMTWREVAVTDDTARLVRPGMLGFVGAQDSTALARFDKSFYWLRGRVRQATTTPPDSTVNAMFLNALWATQAQTVRNETLGSGSGEPNQSFFVARKPVLDSQVIEVRELDGARAAVELPILARDVDSSDLNVVYDGQRKVRQVWVRWHEVPNLYFSGPDDRHYVVERSLGRIMFGDGVTGRLLPAGTDNVVAREYRTGGGAAGNVAVGALSQLLGGVPYVSGVTNPRAAEGGADGETVEQVRERGPQVLRHRERALSARDYEALAHEASPAVAVARALATTHSSGRPTPGWVKLIIVPHSRAAQPQPSFELRRQVHDYVMDRAPASLADIFVTGPTYLPVGASVVVAPIDLNQAGPVGVAVREALEAFFHPLTGGPDGRGWAMGRAVYLSDVAAKLEALQGVDYVQELDLLLDGITQGERVDVANDRIVVAGPMRVRIIAREGTI